MENKNSVALPLVKIASLRGDFFDYESTAESPALRVAFLKPAKLFLSSDLRLPISSSSFCISSFPDRATLNLGPCGPKGRKCNTFPNSFDITYTSLRCHNII